MSGNYIPCIFVRVSDTLHSMSIRTRTAAVGSRVIRITRLDIDAPR